MLSLLIPSFFLYLFGTFNLFGIKQGYIFNQIFFIVIGIIIYIIVKKAGIQFFRSNTRFFYWLFIVLLIATYVIGLEAKGSRRWIDIYFFNFQASEFFKIFFILFFADFIAKNRQHLKEPVFFLKSLGYFLLPTIIIFKQPDLANALVYVFIFFVMCFFSPIPKKFFLYISVVAILVMPLSFVFLKQYQKARIISFFNPHVDQKGISYNMTQAIITVGSGNLVGKGMGMGTQTQLFFLPENHTDFAFSSLIEQFGFFGGLSVIILYLVMALSLTRKVIHYYYQRTEEGMFKTLFVLGFFAFFIFQAFVNMGMNLGILPVAGITLPLISYGGSSFITWILGLALLP